MWLKKENQINKVTAISGSGPGYVFLFIDAFEKAAQEVGLSKKQTDKLVHQTLLGSVNLFFSQNQSAENLTNKIAVEGGTTEAGLKQFNKNPSLHLKFKNVIKSALLKSIQLGK